MKSLQIIFLQACLLIMAACGPKGPRVVQKEGFTLIYDTLAFDVSDIDFRSDFPLEFVNVVPLDDGYLCAFEQRKPGPYSPYPQRYLLRVDRETGKTHAVDFPERQHLHWNIKERGGEVYMVYPEWCDTMWRFIPEQEAWEDATEYRYFYFTDLARFRGLADPKVGILCDSLSDYASTLTESHPMMPSALRSRYWEMKVFGTIYAFGEGNDGYNGCEYVWQCPDTVFNASFKAQKSMYQIVTDPETTWIAQVTGQGLKRIVNLEKRYDAWRVGQDQLCYQDDTTNIGIIELGDTLRFHHLHY